VLANLPRVLQNAHRRVAKRRGAILKAEEIFLYCLVEQTPDPSSRVTLAERIDALGMPILRIDWRIGELERRSVVRLNKLIGLELKRIGLPEYSSNSRLSDDFEWRSHFVDLAHPSGTTRMADSPKQGVVDRNCKVHGVAGLYVAGSSVFPTAGHGNPTLMIVAMAIRLADWLKRQEFAHA
jgi:choline dehydrogenase-like flavoprotein